MSTRENVVAAWCKEKWFASGQSLLHVSSIASVDAVQKQGLHTARQYDVDNLEYYSHITFNRRFYHVGVFYGYLATDAAFNETGIATNRDINCSCRGHHINVGTPADCGCTHLSWSGCEAVTSPSLAVPGCVTLVVWGLRSAHAWLSPACLASAHTCSFLRQTFSVTRWSDMYWL